MGDVTLDFFFQLSKQVKWLLEHLMKKRNISCCHFGYEAEFCLIWDEGFGLD